MVVRQGGNDIVIRPKRDTKIIFIVQVAHAFIRISFHFFSIFGYVGAGAVSLRRAQHIDPPNGTADPRHDVPHVGRVHSNMVAAAFELFQKISSRFTNF